MGKRGRCISFCIFFFHSLLHSSSTVDRLTAPDVYTRQSESSFRRHGRVYSSCEIKNYHFLQEPKILVRSNINDI